MPERTKKDVCEFPFFNVCILIQYIFKVIYFFAGNLDILVKDNLFFAYSSRDRKRKSENHTVSIANIIL